MPPEPSRKHTWRAALLSGVLLSAALHALLLSGTPLYSALSQQRAAAPEPPSTVVAALQTRRVPQQVQAPPPPAAPAPSPKALKPATGSLPPKPRRAPAPMRSEPAFEEPRTARLLPQPGPAQTQNEQDAALVEAPQSAPQSTADTAPPALAQPSQEDSLAATPELLHAAAAQASVPNSQTLHYALEGHTKRINYRASSVLQWARDASSYTASLSVSAFLMGTRQQSSQGSITGHGLQPRRFVDVWRSQQATHFERSPDGGGQFIFSNNRPSLNMLPGAQDQISAFIQLSALLAAAPQRYGAAGSRIVMQVAGVRSAQLWTWQSLGEESTDTAYGERVASIHLKRAANEQYDKTIDLWLAPQWQYLPVRIRIEQSNGDVADMLLKSRP